MLADGEAEDALDGDSAARRPPGGVHALNAMTSRQAPIGFQFTHGNTPPEVRTFLPAVL
jgi:hypothetical protein